MRPDPPTKRLPEDQRVHLLVAGSRTYDGPKHYELIRDHLDYFTSNMDDPIIIHGGARGVDRIAAQWAEWHWYLQKVFYPDYEKHPGKIAPLKRNEEMAQVADYLVAFYTDLDKDVDYLLQYWSSLKKYPAVIIGG